MNNTQILAVLVFVSSGVTAWAGEWGGDISLNYSTGNSVTADGSVHPIRHSQELNGFYRSDDGYLVDFGLSSDTYSMVISGVEQNQNTTLTVGQHVYSGYVSPSYEIGSGHRIGLRAELSRTPDVLTFNSLSLSGASLFYGKSGLNYDVSFDFGRYYASANGQDESATALGIQGYIDVTPSLSVGAWGKYVEFGASDFLNMSSLGVGGSYAVSNNLVLTAAVSHNKVYGDVVDIVYDELAISQSSQSEAYLTRYSVGFQYVSKLGPIYSASIMHSQSPVISALEDENFDVDTTSMVVGIKVPFGAKKTRRQVFEHHARRNFAKDLLSF